MSIFNTIIQGDDGDQLWEVDSEITHRREQAREVAGTLLRFAKKNVDGADSDAATLTAYIYEGSMVDHGDEDDPDLVFEPNPSIEAERIREDAV
jgi:hypothetical protein